MKRRIWMVGVGLAAVAALIAVPAAMAAYTSPKLEVTQTATGVVVKASTSTGDDATFRAQIFAPVGTQVTTSQAPGTALGQVRALVSALALAGAELPLEGQLVVAAPGQVSPGAQAQCTQGVTPLATWLMVLQAAGQTINLPLYLLPVAASETSLGAAKVVVCLAPPGVPVDQGGAVFGAKFLSSEFTISGVFSRVTTGAWIAIWTPWTGNTPPINAAGTVASPAAIAPGAITLTARIAGKGARLTGRVTQGGQGRSATVTIFSGSRAGRLSSVGRARVTATGTFTFRARAGTFFRARAVAAPGAAPAVCTQIQPLISTVPCVNPTSNGFNVQSAVVRKRR
jgi:hypothetical protein